MNSLKIAFAAAMFAVGATAAVAQTAAPAPATKAPAAATAPTTTAPAAKGPATAAAPATDAKKGAKTPQTPESKACSDQADAQNLKGKPRQAFRKKCIKAAKDAAKAAATAKKPS